MTEDKRRFWEKAFFVLLALPDVSIEVAAEDADCALKEWEKRWGAHEQRKTK